MTDFHPQEYGPFLADLLCEDIVQPLGPGRPNTSARGALESMTLENVFEGRVLVDREMARCVLAGVWLHHNFLGRSHDLSQGVKTPTGSYWHALMHRREPDHPNAKFWFSQAGDHPVFGPLARAAADEAAGFDDPQAKALTDARSWNPAAFVDLCESAADAGGEREAFCRHVQMREWRLLFDFCYRRAIRD